MKVAAILLMVMGIVMILGFGIFYLLGFAMSFDAPGSAQDPKAWGMRFLMFVPILMIIIAVIFSFVSFMAGNYKKSVIIGAVPVVVGLLLVGALMLSSFSSLSKYKAQRARELEDERLYPKQTFMRHREGATDTIIVWPSRIVAYRLNTGMPNPYGGPIGDLNESRDTITYEIRTDTKIAAEELEQFVDEQGRKLTDVYKIKIDPNPPFTRKID